MKVRQPGVEDTGWILCPSCGKDNFKSLSNERKRELGVIEGIRMLEHIVPLAKFYECTFCHSVVRVGPFDTTLAVTVDPPRNEKPKKPRVRRQWRYAEGCVERTYKRMKNILDE